MEFTGSRCHSHICSIGKTLNNRTLKRRRYRHYRAALKIGDILSPEHRAWLESAPIGQEFGSPNYERLTALDVMKSFSKGDEVTAETVTGWLKNGRNRLLRTSFSAHQNEKAEQAKP